MKYIEMMINFIMSNPLLQATTTVILLMIANQFMGVSLAKITDEFDWKKFKDGLFKYLTYIICWLFTVSAGLINPDLIVVVINGANVTIIVALTMVTTGGSVYFGYKVIDKFAILFGGKYKVEEIKPVNNIEVAEDYVSK